MRTELNTYGGERVFIDIDDSDRIRKRSPIEINQRIEESIVQNVRNIYKNDKEDITRRIEDLEGEWDIDRSTVFASSVLASLFLLFGIVRNKKSGKSEYWQYSLGAPLTF